MLSSAFGLLTAVTYTGYLITLREARAQSNHRGPAREVAVVSLATALLLGLAAAVAGLLAASYCLRKRQSDVPPTVVLGVAVPPSKKEVDEEALVEAEQYTGKV